jgi:hypothetical protein
MKLDKLKTAIQITGESCCEIDGKIHIAKNGVNTPITDSQQSEIDTQYVSDSANYDSKQYQRDRIYPSWEDQLDKIYHDGVAKWKSEMIDPIKNAHPKP